MGDHHEEVGVRAHVDHGLGHPEQVLPLEQVLRHVQVFEQRELRSGPGVGFVSISLLFVFRCSLFSFDALVSVWFDLVWFGLVWFGFVNLFVFLFVFW